MIRECLVLVISLTFVGSLLISSIYGLYKYENNSEIRRQAAVIAKQRANISVLIDQNKAYRRLNNE